ncbi:MAG: PrkA family serine protein kinase, partial [Magnetospirillum sp.]
MAASNDIFTRYSRAYEGRKEVDLSLLEYLEGCREDPMMYASAAERMIAAIGQPEIIDTAKDARLSRVFMNRTIKVFPAFSEF